MTGNPDPRLPGIAVKVVDCDVEIGVMVVGDGAEGLHGLWRDQVPDESPSCHEVADSPVAPSVPTHKGSYNSSDKPSLEGRRQYEFVPGVFLLSIAILEKFHIMQCKRSFSFMD
jgi:hypothetical protein